MFTVQITLADSRAPRGKLADAALVFDTTSDMHGLTLQGFAVWDGREPGTIDVSFPIRTYLTRGGEKRSYTILRLVNPDEPKAHEWLSDLIAASYTERIKASPRAAATAPEPPHPATEPEPARQIPPRRRPGDTAARPTSGAPRR